MTPRELSKTRPSPSTTDLWRRLLQSWSAWGVAWLMSAGPSLLGPYPSAQASSTSAVTQPSRLILGPELKLNTKFPVLPPGDLEVESIEGGTVYLRSKSKKITGLAPIKTNLVDVREIGWFPVSSPSVAEKGQPPLNPHPYLLVSARTCAACPATERSLFFLRVASNLDPIQLSYPGRIVDAKKGQVVLESRSFYGECLRGGSTVFVSFQKELIKKNNKLYPSVYVAEPAADFIRERQIEKGLPSLKETLDRVKQNRCFEIAGRNRTTLEKPLDLLIRREADAIDDDSAVDRTEEKGPSAEDPANAELNAGGPSEES